MVVVVVVVVVVVDSRHLEDDLKETRQTIENNQELLASSQLGRGKMEEQGGQTYIRS
jgi:hypothetical protein